MKIEIKDLLNSCIDEGEIDMTIRTDDVDMEKIRRETMNWIQSQQNPNYSKRKKRGIVFALLAAVVLLFGSITTAAYINHMKVTTGLNSDVPVSITDGIENWVAPKVEIEVPAMPEGKAEHLGFRVSYLPKMDLENCDITETSLREYAAVIENDSSEHTTKYIAKVGKGGKGKEISDGNELYKDSFYYLNHSSVDALYCIEVKSITSIGRTFYLYDDCNIEKNSTINDEEAIYLTTDLSKYGETDPERKTLYRIIVFDETNNAFLNVSSTLGFKEIEKIIEGLEIVHTGIVSPADSVASEGGWLSGYGVG